MQWQCSEQHWTQKVAMPGERSGLNKTFDFSNDDV